MPLRVPAAEVRCTPVSLYNRRSHHWLSYCGGMDLSDVQRRSELPPGGTEYGSAGTAGRSGAGRAITSSSSQGAVVSQPPVLSWV